MLQDHERPVGLDAGSGVHHAPCRRVRFNEMEWSVPAERGADALREIRAFIARRGFPLMFPLEYR
ncbi:D-arabinono-1,4-lactone oxidase, partial [Burkholderia sp. Se-20373]|uniref:D-arabinono-1,4-lactone oxidase n=1 Tax=Burkholderia sp. Se-20373 TaxID=2703898 RepID=UPI0032162890